MTAPKIQVIISLAVNTPDRAQAVAAAADSLCNLFTRVRVSPIEITAPLSGHGANYANAVAVAETTLPPEAVVVALKCLEANAGRQRLNRNDIPLDLDLLDYDGQELPALRLPRKSQLSLDFNRRALAELSR